MFASYKETAAFNGGNGVLINEHSLGFGEAVVQGCPEYTRTGSVRCHFGGSSADVQQQLYAKFSINLQQTGLVVAPEAHWHRLGPEAYTQRSIRRSKVRSFLLYIFIFIFFV